MEIKKRKLSIGILIILGLGSAVYLTKLFRGFPTAIEDEPHKILGPVDAKVFIVEFSEYTCHFCKEMQPELKKLQGMFPNDLKIIYKHSPRTMKSPSAKAAEAAECAADQNAFWPYSDILFTDAINWFDKKEIGPIFSGYAKNIGLNVETFNACFESGTKREIVERNKNEGLGFMITGTPTLILNGRRVIPNHDIKILKRIVELSIKEQDSIK